MYTLFKIFSKNEGVVTERNLDILLCKNTINIYIEKAGCCNLTKGVGKIYTYLPLAISTESEFGIKTVKLKRAVICIRNIFCCREVCVNIIPFGLNAYVFIINNPLCHNFLCKVNVDNYGRRIIYFAQNRSIGCYLKSYRLFGSNTRNLGNKEISVSVVFGIDRNLLTVNRF